MGGVTIMRILVSVLGDLLGPGLVEILGRDSRISCVDFAGDMNAVVSALRRERYDIHLVGASCLGLALQIARMMTSGTSGMLLPGERVLFAVEADPMQVLEARRVGFARVVGPSADLADRLLVPTGSVRWLNDAIDKFPVGRGSTAPRVVEICRDETDRRILVLLTQGMSDSDIAEKIHYGVQSVRNRVSRMLHRSGFRNRTELAVKMLTRSGR